MKLVLLIGQKLFFIQFKGDKMKLFNVISSTAAIIGGFILQQLGGFDSLLQAIITLVVIDYITGLIKAVSKKELSSKVGFRGITKKVMIFFVIATSVVIEKMVGVGSPVREITIMFFIANEGISILENASEFLPIPEKLKSIMLQIRGDDGEKDAA